MKRDKTWFVTELSPERDMLRLDRMLEQLTKRGKKVLVAIDETLANAHVREFASRFHIYMRRNCQVFLLMTGLHERVYELQNQDTLAERPEGTHLPGGRSQTKDLIL